MDSGNDPVEAPLAVDLVHMYLKGQNLEQLGRVDEAVQLYENAVRASFDSPGPYDRLIEIYSARAQHPDVVRVAQAARTSVHTHTGKHRWYESMAEAAHRAAAKIPSAAPKRPPA
jgi:hypothetical protein